MTNCFSKRRVISTISVIALSALVSFQHAYCGSIGDDLGKLNTDLKNAFGGGTVGEVAKDEIIVPLGGLLVGGMFYALGVGIAGTEASAGEESTQVNKDIEDFKQLGDFFYQESLVCVCVLDLYLSAKLMAMDMKSQGWVMLTKSAIADYFLFREAGPIFDDGKKETEAIVITGGIILFHAVTTYVNGEKLRKLQKTRGEFDRARSTRLVMTPIKKRVMFNFVKNF